MSNIIQMPAPAPLRGRRRSDRAKTPTGDKPYERIDELCEMLKRQQTLWSKSLTAGTEILDEIRSEIERLGEACSQEKVRRRPPGFSESSRAEDDNEIRSLMQFAGYGMAKVALDGKILVCNPVFSRMLGYTPTELEKMTFADITHPDDVQQDWENVLELISGASDSYWMRKRYLHRKGNIVWATIQVWAVRDRARRLRYFAGIVQPAAAHSKPRIVAG